MCVKREKKYGRTRRHRGGGGCGGVSGGEEMEGGRSASHCREWGENTTLHTICIFVFFLFCF